MIPLWSLISVLGLPREFEPGVCGVPNDNRDSCGIETGVEDAESKRSLPHDVVLPRILIITPPSPVSPGRPW